MERVKKTKEDSTPGPASYASLPKEHINSRGTVWAKDKIKRFKKDPLVNMGPGKYTN